MGALALNWNGIDHISLTLLLQQSDMGIDLYDYYECEVSQLQGISI